MNLILACLAVVPGILIVIYIIRKDKVEPEPKWLVALMVICGAVVTSFAGQINAFMDAIFAAPFSEGTLIWAIMESFPGAAVGEELVKMVPLLIFIWPSKNFNYRFDGVVYAVAVAVGFTIMEDLWYDFEYGLGTAVMRGLIPAHVFFAVFMGLYLSKAKKASIDGQRARSKNYLLMAYIIPVIIHGIYDTLCFWYNMYPLVSFVSFGMIILLYVICIAMIKDLSKKDFQAGFYQLTPWQ